MLQPHVLSRSLPRHRASERDGARATLHYLQRSEGGNSDRAFTSHLKQKSQSLAKSAPHLEIMAHTRLCAQGNHCASGCSRLHGSGQVSTGRDQFSSPIRLYTSALHTQESNRCPKQTNSAGTQDCSTDSPRCLDKEELFTPSPK